jgi:PAS domain S-box-containing protein
LLLILGGISAVAVWRVQSDRAVRRTLESRATVVAEVNDARAEFFLDVNLLTAGILGGDPAPFIEEYRQRRLLAAESIAAARAELAALNETEETAKIDTIGDSIEGMLQDIDAGMDIAVNFDQETIIRMAAGYERDMWPRFETIIADIKQLAKGQQAELVADRAAADGASETTLSLLIGLGVAAFLLASATLAMFLTSLLRPLASLQASARAITSGNWEARAKVSGPEETASLAQDFNQMITERKEAEEALRKRTHDLGERAKELNCLYGISNLVQRPDISLEEILQGTGNFIPPAWQYPEITCARIVLGGQEYLTDNFRETAWRQTSDIIVNGERTGAVEVCYLEEKPESDDGPFLTEERGLINAIAERLGRVSERRRAEQALRESEERFRLAINATEDGLWEWDIQTNQEFFSPRWCEIIGYLFDDPELPHTYESWASRIHPDDYDRVASAMTNHLEKGTRYDVDYRHRHKSGEYRWQNSKGQAVLGESGKPIKMVGCISDITERKRAEEALRESEERFRTLSASAPVGIFLMDDKGQIIYTNERLQAIAGPIPQGSRNIDLVAVAHPDDRERMLAEATRQQEGPAEDSQEYRILTPQGETRWVHARVSPILAADGSRSGVVGTIEDITEQRQAEETLRESEEKYRDLFENASDLIQSVAVDGPFVYVNPAWRETLGYSEEEIGGLSFMDIIHPDSKAHCAELFERVMAGERVDHLEAMFVTKEGKTIAVEGSAGGTVKDGEIVGTRGIFRDISERQRAEEERRKAYESIVLLLATAAEARDPYTEDHLYRIRGFAEAIAAELGLPPDEIREIGLSSFLHDLGKMRVPDSILTKPGPLSAAEWKIMKQHPLWGEELLSAHPWLETARQIARWHHERWDGAGYPDGLRAEQIPLGAAIVTVADALDAMISDRPYKGAWPQQQAVREIRAHKGRQFSPSVVEAFNRALRKGEIKRVTDATLRLSEPARAA